MTLTYNAYHVCVCVKDSEIQNLKQDLEIVRDSKASVEVELQQSKETLENTVRDVCLT